VHDSAGVGPNGAGPAQTARYGRRTRLPRFLLAAVVQRQRGSSRSAVAATLSTTLRFVKPIDTPGALAAAITSALLIAQQVAGKAARDALFLSSFRTSHLPVAMALGAILSLAAVHWVSWLMVRKPPASLMPLLLGGSAAGFTLEWLTAFNWPRLTAALVYGQTAIVGPVVLSAFWSLINERFDPHTGKRAVARIAAGGTLGGVLGGLSVWRASTLIDPHMVLLLLALINAAGVVGVLVTSARGPAATPSSSAEGNSHLTDVTAYGELRRAPFLRNLALLVALGAATSAILDYIFSVQAVAAFGTGPELLSFFALFWLAVGALSFLLQLTLGRVALEKLGLAVSISVLPGLILLGGAFGLAIPGLASAAVLRGAEAVQRNTLFRSAYELLYTPLSEERKRATKVLIDVGFDRLGTVLGSGVALLALWLFAPHPSPFLLAAVVLLALATLPVVRSLHVGYVEALQQGLRDAARELELATEEPTRLTEAPGRELLIQRMEDLKPGGLTTLLEAGVTPTDAALAAGPALEALQSPERVLSTARDLVSTNVEQAKRGLEKLEPHGPEVACAILLLAHRELHQHALRALTRIGPAITGQLLDVLLDSNMDFVVRRKIPRVLRSCPTQRAAEGLLLGINDARFEVRYECGRALLALTHDNPELVISQEKAIEAIQREVADGKRILETLGAQFDDDDPNADDSRSSLVDGLVRDRVDRSLEHVFTILCLHLEREPLRLAFRALHHEDTNYRGTALEYLDTVLPVQIRELIWPLLGDATPLPSARPAHELLADLALAARPRPS
jgi:ATP:ADP antiporter, AAA family